METEEDRQGEQELKSQEEPPSKSQLVQEEEREGSVQQRSRRKESRKEEEDRPGQEDGAQVSTLCPADQPGGAGEEAQGGTGQDITHAWLWGESVGEKRLILEEQVPPEQSLGRGAVWERRMHYMQPGIRV